MQQFIDIRKSSDQNIDYKQVSNKIIISRQLSANRKSMKQI